VKNKAFAALHKTLPMLYNTVLNIVFPLRYSSVQCLDSTTLCYSIALLHKT